jgi:hypothetical protein
MGDRGNEVEGWGGMRGKRIKATNLKPIIKKKCNHSRMFLHQHERKDGE